VHPRSLLVSVGIVLAPAIAWAQPAAVTDTIVDGPSRHLLHAFVEKERGAVVHLPKRILDALRGTDRPGVPRPPTFRDEPMTLDCQHAKHDITLDPMSGATSATLELNVRASGGALDSIGLVLDEGLEIHEVTAMDRATDFADAVYSPLRVARIVLSPALAPETSTVVRVTYSGSLSCGASAETNTMVCAKGRDFSYFAHQSIFPYVFDPQAPESSAFDGLTREIVLRVPMDVDVVATGESKSQVVDGGRKVSTWTIDRPLSRIVQLYAFAGKLGFKPVHGRAVPTTLVFPSPETVLDLRLAAWSPPALDFIERASGGKLPFERSLTLVRLPRSLNDPGTATFGMTLLSDSYAAAGDVMYEETWAHENAHLFWGIVVPEAYVAESRLMSEGMATLTELDYSFERHFASESRDLYLARRLLPMGLDLRAASPLPPVQLAPNIPPPDAFRTDAYTLWAYYKTAATLDHLRVTVGEDHFARAIASYVERCRYVGCRPSVLREVLEEETGTDLRPFFERWVTGSERPQVLVGFTPTPNGAEVALTKPDDRPMTLEIWLTLATGDVLKQRVDLGPRVSLVHVDAPSPVLRVAASPRHDVLVDVRSVVEGDLDFDGETDGFDILRCAMQLGRKYESKGAAVGLWNLAETFDPRCDVDGNFVIDDADLTKLAESFGKLRPR
jgi:hypothetical protein